MVMSLNLKTYHFQTHRRASTTNSRISKDTKTAPNDVDCEAQKKYKDSEAA
jgi:hypothetical protein